MIRELSPELAVIAQRELNENPKQILDQIKKLKEWILSQPHLRARTDNQWLIAVIRGCKFDFDKVKGKLDLYYTLRTTAPEVTLRLKPNEAKFLDFLRLGTCLIFRKPKTGLHPRVIVFRAGRYDPEKNNVTDVMCIFYYLIQILVIEDDTASVIGIKIVVDYKGVGWKHLVQASPSVAKKLIAVCQDALPLRIKGSHHMNLPPGIETIFKIVSPFLNEKSRQRLKVHKKPVELLKHLPKEVIPVEYGGSGGNISELIDYWAGKIVEYRSWMELEAKLGTDECKRIGKRIHTNKKVKDFRNLEID